MTDGMGQVTGRAPEDIAETVGTEVKFDRRGNLAQSDRMEELLLVCKAPDDTTEFARAR